MSFPLPVPEDQHHQQVQSQDPLRHHEMFIYIQYVVLYKPCLSYVYYIFSIIVLRTSVSRLKIAAIQYLHYIFIKVRTFIVLLCNCRYFIEVRTFTVVLHMYLLGALSVVCFGNARYERMKDYFIMLNILIFLKYILF